MERRTRWILPIGGVLLAGLLWLPACRGGEEEPAAGTGGPEDVSDADGDSGGGGSVPPVTTDDPVDVDEDFERRARNAAAAERQRELLIEELSDLPASRFTSAVDVAILIPAEEPPRLFRLDEKDLEAMPPLERAEAIARYDRLARGLLELAVRAIDEAAELRERGDDERADDLLQRIRALAAVSGGDDVAEIGRDAARAVVVRIDEAMPPAGG